MVWLELLGSIIKGIALLYWLLGLALLYCAIRFPRTKLRAAIWSLIVIAAFAYLPVKTRIEHERKREAHAAIKARFDAHCKNSGEKIHRTAQDVEGVFLLKLRQTTNRNLQFEMDDPYGDDSTGDDYIASFLAVKIRPKEPLIAGAPPRNGYQYVEAVDSDGKRYRYTGHWIEPWQTDKSYLQGHLRFVLDKALATGPAPRYGVTYDDLSTLEDRQYWIAGSSLRVIDLQTNEVMAERIGYMWDPAQGNTSGGRSPWLLAANHACPGFQGNPLVPPNGHMASRRQQQTQEFVEKVLFPKIEK